MNRLIAKLGRLSPVGEQRWAACIAQDAPPTRSVLRAHAEIHAWGRDCFSTAGPVDPVVGIGWQLHSSATTDLPDGVYAEIREHSASQSWTLRVDPLGIQTLLAMPDGDGWVVTTSPNWLRQFVARRLALTSVGMHQLLAFGFSPAGTTPFAEVIRVPPGGQIELQPSQSPQVQAGESFRESIDPEWDSLETAIPQMQTLLEQAVLQRINGQPTVGLYLSGGLDSSAVAVTLRNLGIRTQAFTLDFGEASVERDDAECIAAHLGIPIERVPVNAESIAAILPELVAGLELPFGDAVTGPQWFLGQAARQFGLCDVFNGEGGDQLLGGWTNKPMIAAELYGQLSREDAYLQAFHRFLGLEDRFYTPEFLADLGSARDCRPVLAQWVHAETATTFLHRMRLTDLMVKGCGNILPRMHAIGNALGLRVHAPLMDRTFTQFALSIPPGMKLRGATEKVILRQWLQQSLPERITQRRKTGMCVPITWWLLAEKSEWWRELLLGRESRLLRGWLRRDALERLCAGMNEPNEVRIRRVGERLWTLIQLEWWLRQGQERSPWERSE
ncbi:asparagine synthetase B family protein [Tuwongella immobilis]|uniref:asparagine synthase (glutamine-hydrolyzing) n=1 Tax=Tuwongella immobilis TaxID=692036 RepID=A0A6C2YQ61_9BACT|nr:asparagine synthase [Tuwongella immobilis]VIP03487.1 asparagine synthase : Asparagine synthetase OS=Hyalangium minutum GN=DB31_6150 PE=4 SV=1: Asn_synthase [Tuwongella immobilis]VTS04344.1 asparagine synthase : Asparagine synthetase OS=Hyalangium minutum GN=DB31_6150 PE=4 SV=1: Asn_synthase [Tuwongella immobilis]